MIHIVRRTALFALIIFISTAAFSQDTLKLMQYNLLFYGDCSGVSLDNKDSWLEDVTGFYKPDVFTVNEMTDRIAYANRIKVRALTYANMEYTEFTNSGGSPIVNMLFYNADKLGYKGIQTIPSNAIRDINVYTLYHKNSINGSDTTFFDCIVAHLKAGNGSANQTQRAVAAADVMSWIAAQGSDYKNYLIMGDFNLYHANEPAWRTLVFNPNPAIKFIDPSGAANGWGASTLKVLTQSTRSNSNDCGSGGGFDDRFDFMLTSDAIFQGSAGVSYVPESFEVVGNNGTVSFNGSFDCTGNPAVPTNICSSLILMSDHLPVAMKLAISSTVPVDPLFKPVSLSGLQNPFSENLQFNITTHTPTQTLEVNLLSPSGQVVYRQVISSSSKKVTVSVPTSTLATGMYFLQVRPGKGVGVVKKVVKR